MKKDKKIKFDLFGLAYDKYQALMKTEKKARIKRNILGNGKIKLLWDLAFNIIGNISIPTMLVSSGAKELAETTVDYYFSKNKEFIKRIDQCKDSRKCLELVTDAFIYDYNKSFIEEKKTYTIFIDTYEYYSRQLDVQKVNTDRWLSTFLLRLAGNTVWIILGRERLNWSNVKFFKQIHIDVFKEDSSFIKIFTDDNINITEKEHQKYIKNASQGFPFVLHDYIEQYIELSKSGGIANIENINGNITGVLERLLGDISSGSKLLLLILSYMQTWTHEDIDIILSVFIEVNIIDFEILLKYQLIQENYISKALANVIIGEASYREKEILINRLNSKKRDLGEDDADELILLDKIYRNIVLIRFEGESTSSEDRVIMKKEEATNVNNYQDDIIDNITVYIKNLRKVLTYDIVRFENAFLSLWEQISENRGSSIWIHGEIVYRKYLKNCGYEDKIADRIEKNNQDRDLLNQLDRLSQTELLDCIEARIAAGYSILNDAGMKKYFKAHNPEQYYYLMLYWYYVSDDFELTDDLFNEYIYYLDDCLGGALYFDIYAVYLDILQKQNRQDEEYEIAQIICEELSACRDIDLKCKIKQHIIINKNANPEEACKLAEQSYEDVLSFYASEFHPTVISKKIDMAIAYAFNREFDTASEYFNEAIQITDINSFEYACYKSNYACAMVSAGRERDAQRLFNDCLDAFIAGDWFRINKAELMIPTIKWLHQYEARQRKPSKSKIRKLYEALVEAKQSGEKYYDGENYKLAETYFWLGWIGCSLNSFGWKTNLRKALVYGKQLWGKDSPQYIQYAELINLLTLSDY